MPLWRPTERWRLRRYPLGNSFRSVGQLHAGKFGSLVASARESPAASGNFAKLHRSLSSDCQPVENNERPAASLKLLCFLHIDTFGASCGAGCACNVSPLTCPEWPEGIKIQRCSFLGSLKQVGWNVQQPSSVELTPTTHT